MNALANVSLTLCGVGVIGVIMAFVGEAISSGNENVATFGGASVFLVLLGVIGLIVHFIINVWAS